MKKILIFITVIFIISCNNSKNTADKIVEDELLNALSEINNKTKNDSDKNLVAYFNFDNIDEYFLIDEKSNLSGIISDIEIVDTPFNKGLKFNGSSSYCNLKQNSESKFTNNSFTIELWVYFEKEQKQYYPTIIHKPNEELGGGSPTYAIGIYSNEKEPDNKLIFAATTNIDTYKIISSVNWNEIGNQWNYLACSFGNDKMDFYLNGVLLDSISVSGNLIEKDNSNIYLGRTFNPKSNHFSGIIDEIRITNVAKNKNEIKKYFISSRKKKS